MSSCKILHLNISSRLLNFNIRGCPTLNLISSIVFNFSSVSVSKKSVNIFNISSVMYPNYMIKGGGGDDTFNIIGNLTGLTINGEAGTNVVTGEVGSNTTINVVGANSGTVSLVKGVE